MTNRQINSHLKAFAESRQNWIDILARNPHNSHACQIIMSINSKMELLRVLWDWNDESVEMAVVL